MSDMKCPFCQQELDMNMGGECGCPNEQCQKSVFMFGSEELWQELIRTRKALDDAKKWLMKIGYLNMSDHGLGSERMMTDWRKTVALHALEEIKTALEQKD